MLLEEVCKFLLGIVAVLVLAGFGTLQLPAFGGRFDGERLERMQRSRDNSTLWAS